LPIFDLTQVLFIQLDRKTRMAVVFNWHAHNQRHMFVIEQSLLSFDSDRQGFSDETNAATAIMSSMLSFATCRRICNESAPERAPDFISNNWRTM